MVPGIRQPVAETAPQSREALWLWRIIVALLAIVAGLLALLWTDLKNATAIQNKDIRDIRESIIRLEGQWTPADRAELTAWRIGMERRMTKVESGKQ